MQPPKLSVSSMLPPVNDDLKHNQTKTMFFTGLIPFNRTSFKSAPPAVTSLTPTGKYSSQEPAAPADAPPSHSATTPSSLIRNHGLTPFPPFTSAQPTSYPKPPALPPLGGSKPSSNKATPKSSATQTADNNQKRIQRYLTSLDGNEVKKLIGTVDQFILLYSKGENKPNVEMVEKIKEVKRKCKEKIAEESETDKVSWKSLLAQLESLEAVINRNLLTQVQTDRTLVDRAVEILSSGEIQLQLTLLNTLSQMITYGEHLSDADKILDAVLQLRERVEAMDPVDDDQENRWEDLEDALNTFVKIAKRKGLLNKKTG